VLFDEFHERSTVSAACVTIFASSRCRRRSRVRASRNFSAMLPSGEYRGQWGEMLATVAKAGIFRQRQETAMPTRNVSLTPEQDAFIDEFWRRANTGTPAKRCVMPFARCSSAGRLDSLKLDKLRLSIQAGVAALECGEYDEVDDADLDTYLDDLAAPASR